MDQDINDEKELTPQEELEQLSEEIQTELLLFNKKTRDFLKRNKAGETIAKEEETQHVEHRKMITQLEKAYASMHKMVYPKGTKQPEALTGAPNMAKVHQMKPTIGGIITKIANGE